MEKEQIREIIAKRVAMELKDGDVVNLGIGLPTAVPTTCRKAFKSSCRAKTACSV